MLQSIDKKFIIFILILLILSISKSFGIDINNLNTKKGVITQFASVYLSHPYGYDKQNYFYNYYLRNKTSRLMGIIDGAIRFPISSLDTIHPSNTSLFFDAPTRTIQPITFFRPFLTTCFDQTLLRGKRQEAPWLL